MKKANNTWLPDNDQHFEKMTSSVGKYQIDTFETAMKFDERRTCFVDCGAHVGYWARQAIWAGYPKVYCFEPVEENYKCLVENLAALEKHFEVETHNVALGLYGTYKMEKECAENSGAYHYRWHEDKYENIVFKLDNFNVAPSLMKIDTQGSECDIIFGAFDVIQEHKPVIVVEQSNSHAAIALLKTTFDYTVKTRIRNDYILCAD